MTAVIGDPLFFFFNDTATTEIYTLSLHDALPISPHEGTDPAGDAAPGPGSPVASGGHAAGRRVRRPPRRGCPAGRARRSEEHTSELQSRQYLVCRLLLEKKKQLTSIDYLVLRVTI